MATASENARKEELLKTLQSTLENFFYKVKSSQAKSGDNLADGQLFLLSLLSQHGICKASDIAAAIGITSGAVTGMTDKLVSAGLIDRERSEKDRRVVLLSLTAKGQEKLNVIRGQRLQRMKELFLQLSEEDLLNTIDVFGKLIRILESGK